MSRKRQLLWRTLIVLAVVAVVAGGSVAWYQQYTNEQVDKVATEQQALANNGHATGDNPSTKKPTQNEFDSYRVASDLPRYISIPKIDVKAIVRQVSLTKDGAIGVPTNVYDTAWYSGSAKPGQPGATLIDGHISTWKTGGVFYNLNKLQQGDEIVIERGDGQILRYSVVKSQTYPVDTIDMQQILSPINPAKPSLNLITCTGNIIKGTTRFDKRIVIFAQQQ